jgi:hypothetical protein
MDEMVGVGDGEWATWAAMHDMELGPVVTFVLN